MVVLMINHVCEFPAKRYILYALIPDKWFKRDADVGHVYSSHTHFWIFLFAQREDNVILEDWLVGRAVQKKDILDLHEGTLNLWQLK